MGTADLAGAGDEAGGVFAGLDDDLHVTDAAGHVGGEVDAAVQGTHDDVAGGHEGLRLGCARGDGQRQRGGEQ